jgi:broad specificity phosphatase PhoE
MGAGDGNCRSLDGPNIEEWVCERCTFMHDGDLSDLGSCSMCETPRNASSKRSKRGAPLDDEHAAVDRRVVAPVFRPLSARKRVCLIRHGESQANTGAWSNHPDHVDSRLTSRGQSQARQLRLRFATSARTFELIVSSPLSRALETSAIAFADQPLASIVVHPWAAEHARLFSDQGRPKAGVARDFPWADLSLVREPDVWPIKCVEPTSAFRRCTAARSCARCFAALDRSLRDVVA